MRLPSPHSSYKRSFRRFSRLGFLLVTATIYVVQFSSTPSPSPRHPLKILTRPSIQPLNHTWETRPDGKIVVPIDQAGNVYSPYNPRRSPRHPFHDLMEQAEQRWDGLLKRHVTFSRQSRSLDEAVMEYRRRYGRSPPLGFDSWYRMAVENNVTLIDEVSREFYALVAKAHQVDMKFDQIDRDIAPFLAIPAAAILDRMAEAQSQPNAFQLTLAGDFITIEGSPRKAAEMVKFLADAIPNLPDMTIYVSYSDIVPYVYGDDFRAEVNRVLAQGEYLSPENITRFESQERNSRQTMTKACFDDAPAVLRENGVTQRETPNQHFRFIYDHLASMSFCDNPDILDNHSAFLNNGSWDSFLIPLFVQSKIRQGANLLYPSLLRFQDFSKVRVTPWSERTNPKLFWRGRTTGGYHWAQRPWRNSHRIRLHNLANNATLGEDIVSLLTEDSAGRLSRKMYRRKELNGAYLDTGLIGPPMQCSEDDGTCDDMRREIKFLKPVWHNFGRNKYMLDVDGNGWSSRYRALLASGSLVLKSTIFPEWNTDWLTPYYHYIPVQHDYSDLYDVMAFFAGSPEGNSGHEDLAEKIGMRAAEFVRHHWRWEDMQTYMYRLLLEYARVINPDREAMSYKV